MRMPTLIRTAAAVAIAICAAVLLLAAQRPGAFTIIGPGGGWDVARALSSGSKDITGVEINPIIATTIMRTQFPQ